MWGSHNGTIGVDRFPLPLREGVRGWVRTSLKIRTPTSPRRVAYGDLALPRRAGEGIRRTRERVAFGFASGHYTRSRARRGVVIVEALVGGLILATGLAVLISLASHAMARQQLGEQRVVAAALLDELLSGVLADGPLDYSKRNNTEGVFGPPFEGFSYRIDIEERSEVDPYVVTAAVRWFSNGYWREEIIQTYISQPRGNLDLEVREPGTPIAR